MSVSGSVTAGPSCPAAGLGTAAPACTPQPLAGVHLTIATAPGGSGSGTVVAQPVTDSTGSFGVALAPGEYRIEGQGIIGLVAPSPAFFDVRPGAGDLRVDVRYDTGLR